ncbi:MAG: serine/threonine protein kinase [Nitrospirae bacterium]|nr:serine/threonine protein kinase [Nitrospirota bacterium]
MEIEPYRIIQKVGEGGSGVVYKAEHNLTGQIVAIKELANGLSSGEEMRERFIREAKILAKLTHKNIVRLYNFIEQDGLFYLIMEFMEGIRLDDVIKKETPMDYGRCIGYLKQILEGVDFAHCQGVVHRDIKPANIIVDNDGIVKIMDFGIAVGDDYLRLTKTGISLGTLRYMSPEQIKGGKVDVQSDIYSIGMTLFEMITDKSPFKGDSAFHLMNAIVKNKLPSPAKFRSDVPLVIEKAILKACAKDPSNRFESAAEFSKALDDWDISITDEKTNKYIAVSPAMEIGPYRIIQKVGEGGSGVVYKAEHNLTGQIVAIKELANGLSSGEEMRERFIREAKILAKLTHKNIVRLYNFIEHDGLFYLVMEFMEGIRLDETIKKETPMDYGRCIGYCKQILEGAGFAHSQGIVHRDIKPANIIVDNDGVVKIMDFGIAVGDDYLRLTKTGTSLGTLRYMSPEQIKGGKVDVQSDIYSIGMTLFEMITGTSPFKGDSAFHLMNAIVKNKIPSASKFRSDVPFAIENTILKACAKDPAERFGNAIEFSKALDDWDISISGEVINEETNKYTPVSPDNDKPLDHDKPADNDKPLAMPKKRSFKIGITALLAVGIIAGTLPFWNFKSHNAKNIPKLVIPARPAIPDKPAILDKSASTVQPTPSVASDGEEKQSSLPDKVKKTVKNNRSSKTAKSRAKAITASSPPPVPMVDQKQTSTPIANPIETPKTKENHDEKHKDPNEGLIDVVSPKKSKD